MHGQSLMGRIAPIPVQTEGEGNEETVCVVSQGRF
ncbi:MAG: hypothetical protein ACI9G1_002921, partial [Pirellulaceae bacterium]